MCWPCHDLATRPGCDSASLAPNTAGTDSCVTPLAELRWRIDGRRRRFALPGFLLFSNVLARSHWLSQLFATPERLRASNIAPTQEHLSRTGEEVTAVTSKPPGQSGGMMQDSSKAQRVRESDVKQLLDHWQLSGWRDGDGPGSSLGSAGLQSSIVLGSSALTRQLGGNCFPSLRYH